MTLALAALLGAVIGISLGALGGGGSVLTVPVLVYVLGESAGQATTASLVIVGVTSLAGVIGHGRAGRVRWRAGIVFGLAGVATSFLGSWANRAIDPDILLLAFSALMLIAATGMLRRARTPHPAPQTAGTRPGPGPGDDAQPLSAPTPPPGGRGTGVRIAAAGLAVGFLTGFFGVGGGFVIVPALTLVLGFTMPEAVATSLLVIVINSAAALTARAGHLTLPWTTVLPFTAAAIAGALAGKHIADRVKSTTLTRAFAVLLVALAAYMAIRSGTDPAR